MPCSHGNRTPRELYEKAIELWYDKCIRIFGRTAEEILNALELWDNAKEPHLSRKREQEQKPMKYPKCDKEINANNTCNVDNCYIGCKKPMTREEAVKIANDKWPFGPNVVAVLEALGLLKFEEAPKKHCLLCKQSFNENEVKNYMCIIPDCTTFIKQKPVKQVEWRHTLGNRCWFSEGYDPNKSDSGWRRVNEVKVEIGKFTRIRMANGSYVQGYIESLEQP